MTSGTIATTCLTECMRGLAIMTTRTVRATREAVWIAMGCLPFRFSSSKT